MVMFSTHVSTTLGQVLIPGYIPLCLLSRMFVVHLHNYLVHLLKGRLDFVFGIFDGIPVFLMAGGHFQQTRQQQRIFGHSLDRNLNGRKFNL